MQAMALKWIYCAGLLLTIATGFFNLGIIGIDDYNNGFQIMAPAQSSPAWKALTVSEIHPWVPMVLLSALSRGVWACGVVDPILQLRCAFALLGAFVFSMGFYAFVRLFAFAPQAKRNFAVAAYSGYFALPLFSSRPMNETLCMPLLALSAAYASEYGTRRKVKSLAFCLGLLALASLMRFQAGVCAAAVVCLVAAKRSLREWAVFLALSAAFFFLSGLPDYLVRGEFHGQVRAYLHYNLQFSGEHFGRMPFYTFIVLCFGLTLPPTLLARYPGFHWRKEFAPLAGPALYGFFFVAAHSLSPHKEDRFMIPVLPLLLASAMPLLWYLWQEGARWRRVWAVGANFFLLVLACTNVAQRNLIELAAFLSRTPSIAGVDALDNALVIQPQAFIARSVDWQGGSLENYQNKLCTRLAVVRSDSILPSQWTTQFSEVARFPPGWVEQLLILANKKNARRGPLIGYLPIDCIAPLGVKTASRLSR
jgi:hypothetical protein